MTQQGYELNATGRNATMPSDSASLISKTDDDSASCRPVVVDQLPHEVLLHILSFVCYATVMSCRTVCRQFRTAAFNFLPPHTAAYLWSSPFVGHIELVPEVVVSSVLAVGFERDTLNVICRGVSQNEIVLYRHCTRTKQKFKGRRPSEKYARITIDGTEDAAIGVEGEGTAVCSGRVALVGGAAYDLHNQCKVPIPVAEPTILSTSRSGKYVVCADFDRCCVIDTATGETIASRDFDHQHGKGTPDDMWVGDDRVVFSFRLTSESPRIPVSCSRQAEHRTLLLAFTLDLRRSLGKTIIRAEKFVACFDRLPSIGESNASSSPDPSVNDLFPFSPSAVLNSERHSPDPASGGGGGGAGRTDGAEPSPRRSVWVAVTSHGTLFYWWTAGDSAGISSTFDERSVGTAGNSSSVNGNGDTTSTPTYHRFFGPTSGDDGDGAVRGINEVSRAGAAVNDQVEHQHGRDDPSRYFDSGRRRATATTATRGEAESPHLLSSVRRRRRLRRSAAAAAAAAALTPSNLNIPLHRHSNNNRNGGTVPPNLPETSFTTLDVEAMGRNVFLSQDNLVAVESTTATAGATTGGDASSATTAAEGTSPMVATEDTSTARQTSVSVAATDSSMSTHFNGGSRRMNPPALLNSSDVLSFDLSIASAPESSRLSSFSPNVAGAGVTSAAESMQQQREVHQERSSFASPASARLQQRRGTFIDSLLPSSVIPPAAASPAATSGSSSGGMTTTTTATEEESDDEVTDDDDLDYFDSHRTIQQHRRQRRQQSVSVSAALALPFTAVAEYPILSSDSYQQDETNVASNVPTAQKQCDSHQTNHTQQQTRGNDDASADRPDPLQNQHLSHPTSTADRSDADATSMIHDSDAGSSGMSSSNASFSSTSSSTRRFVYRECILSGVSKSSTGGTSTAPPSRAASSTGRTNAAVSSDGGGSSSNNISASRTSPSLNSTRKKRQRRNPTEFHHLSDIAVAVPGRLYALTVQSLNTGMMSSYSELVSGAVAIGGGATSSASHAQSPEIRLIAADGSCQRRIPLRGVSVCALHPRCAIIVAAVIKHETNSRRSQPIHPLLEAIEAGVGEIFVFGNEMFEADDLDSKNKRQKANRSITSTPVQSRVDEMPTADPSASRLPRFSSTDLLCFSPFASPVLSTSQLRSPRSFRSLTDHYRQRIIDAASVAVNSRSFSTTLKNRGIRQRQRQARQQQRVLGTLLGEVQKPPAALIQFVEWLTTISQTAILLCLSWTVFNIIYHAWFVRVELLSTINEFFAASHGTPQQHP